MLVVTSYPTEDEESTVHICYGVVGDKSNPSMSWLYTKLGYNNEVTHTSYMIHVNIFPRRLDPKEIDTEDSLSAKSQVP